MAEILPHIVISGTATLCPTLALSRYRTTCACRVRGSRAAPYSTGSTPVTPVDRTSIFAQMLPPAAGGDSGE